MEAKDLDPKRPEPGIHFRQGLDDGSDRPVLHHFNHSEVLEMHRLHGFCNLPLFGFPVTAVELPCLGLCCLDRVILELRQFRRLLHGLWVITWFIACSREIPK